MRNGKPLCIDLYCGLGGWAEGFMAAGFDVVGFDIERHRYPARVIDSATVKSGGGIDFRWHDSFNGTTEKRLRDAPLTGGWDEYPGQLVIQDVTTLDGAQLKDADVIVASPPCQAYSYMAMPWKKAKREMRWQAWERDSPFGDFRLNDLFEACFRLQREAIWAAGRFIPLVVENVCGAQKWVGKAVCHYGSYYLWGDIPACAPLLIQANAQKFNPDGTNHGQGSWFAIADSKNRGTGTVKVPPGMNFHGHEKTGMPGRSFQSAAVKPHGSGRDWWDKALDERRHSAAVRMGTARGATKMEIAGNGVSYGGGLGWDGSAMRTGNSHSPARKAASAQIAKIPFPLAEFVAGYFKP